MANVDKLTLRNSTSKRICLAIFLLTSMASGVLIVRGTAEPIAKQQATSEVGQFSGQVVANAGRPIAGATIHLVPVTAIDLTSRITASSIYAPPYPAENYDEPLEDAIRLKGSTFAQAKTDDRGNFVIASVP